MREHGSALVKALHKFVQVCSAKRGPPPSARLRELVPVPRGNQYAESRSLVQTFIIYSECVFIVPMTGKHALDKNAAV